MSTTSHCEFWVRFTFSKSYWMDTKTGVIHINFHPDHLEGSQDICAQSLVDKLPLPFLQRYFVLGLRIDSIHRGLDSK